MVLISLDWKENTETAEATSTLRRLSILESLLRKGWSQELEWVWIWRCITQQCNSEIKLKAQRRLQVSASAIGRCRVFLFLTLGEFTLTRHCLHYFPCFAAVWPTEPSRITVAENCTKNFRIIQSNGNSSSVFSSTPPRAHTDIIISEVIKAFYHTCTEFLEKKKERKSNLKAVCWGEKNRRSVHSKQQRLNGPIADRDRHTHRAV